MTNLPAAERLFQRRQFGIKPGLDNTLALLAELGNPQQAFACIHVAGTNGKGSVCAMTASMLGAVGLKVGLYTSPHLVRFNERFRVDGVDVDDVTLQELLETVEVAAETVAGRTGVEPTFFECSTAVAFEHFRGQGVQLAVIETGLGGRLDATNVVSPLVTAITRVSLEHTAYLGDTLEAVALEKCGIIKPRVPVVCAENTDAVVGVVQRVAAERNAPLTRVSEAASVTVVQSGVEGQAVRLETVNAGYGKVVLPLNGLCQVENLATAVVLAETTAASLEIPLPERAVKAGVASTRWPGRLMVLSDDPLLLLDGAHNPGAAKALGPSLGRMLQGRSLGLVLGMCADKDAAEFLEPFRGMASRVWCVPIPNERNMPAEELGAAATVLGFRVECCGDVQQGVAAACCWAEANQGVVCVLGSLFLVGEVLKQKAGG